MDIMASIAPLGTTATFTNPGDGNGFPKAGASSPPAGGGGLAPPNLHGADPGNGIGFPSNTGPGTSSGGLAPPNLHGADPGNGIGFPSGTGGAGGMTPPSTGVGGM